MVVVKWAAGGVVLPLDGERETGRDPVLDSDLCLEFRGLAANNGLGARLRRGLELQTLVLRERLSLGEQGVEVFDGPPEPHEEVGHVAARADLQWQRDDLGVGQEPCDAAGAGLARCVPIEADGDVGNRDEGVGPFLPKRQRARRRGDRRVPERLPLHASMKRMPSSASSAVAVGLAERVGNGWDRKITPHWVGYLLRKKLGLRIEKRHGNFVISEN